MIIGIGSQGVAATRASSRPERHRRGTPPSPRGPVRQAGRDATADELPRSIRRAAGLEGFAAETIPLAPSARATAAARAFSAGNGYLPGLIVDRLA